MVTVPSAASDSTEHPLEFSVTADCAADPALPVASTGKDSLTLNFPSGPAVTVPG
jgi:hypothetical protein